MRVAMNMKMPSGGGPTRPRNISAMTTDRPSSSSSPVAPRESPTVPHADTATNNRPRNDPPWVQIATKAPATTAVVLRDAGPAEAVGHSD